MEIRKEQSESQAVQVRPKSATRFKLSRIFTNREDIPQYGRAGKALISAGMSLEFLANAGDEKGDKVERIELDAPANNLQGKVGEIIESADSFQAWQENGEVIVTKQLPTPTSESEVATFQNTEPQKMILVEEVGVFSNQSQEAQLSTNPYLQAPADLKKAA